jgi:endonuclease/exonuclease/phosphatase (EEP) superfamily protein YafD
MLQATLLTLSWVLILATALPFIKHEAWWIRLFDFPRSQITALAVVLMLTLSFRYENGPWQGATLSILLACTAYQLWQLSAYTPLRNIQSLPRTDDDPDRKLSVVAANVLMTNRNVKQYLDIINRERPDLIVLAEPDTYWEHCLRSIEEEYSYTIKCPLGNTYGMLFYSRLPISEPRVRFRVQQDVPSFTCLVRLRTGDEFELHCIHPRPPHVGVDTVERDAELVLVAQEVEDRPYPVIVTGDLNDVAWSHTTRLFLRISGLLDPRVGRGLCNTFHASHPLFRWPLDHLFHSRAFRFIRMVRLEKTESDHFTVLIELNFEPEIRKEQERPEADAEDFVEAREKIATAEEKSGSPHMRG